MAIEGLIEIAHGLSADLAGYRVDGSHLEPQYRNGDHVFMRNGKRVLVVTDAEMLATMESIHRSRVRMVG